MMVPPFLESLPRPGAKVRAVLDTDTYNEIDDQYALAYAALSGNIDLEAVYAAPFLNERSTSPADGVQKSFEEAARVLGRLGRRGESVRQHLFRGSRSFMTSPNAPVRSEAAEDLVARAMNGQPPLYVLAIAAITDVASAILLEPRILGRIVVVWLGGQPVSWHTAAEFNLQQDPVASRLIFDSGVPLVQVPCKNVAEHLRVTPAELRENLRGSGLGSYLREITLAYMETRGARSKVIWDISAVAWLRNPGWVPSNLIHSPILTSALTYSHDPSRHFIRQAIDVNRDAIFEDLYTLLEADR
jgi:purine nucleosidase